MIKGLHLVNILQHPDQRFQPGKVVSRGFRLLFKRRRQDRLAREPDLLAERLQ